MRFSEITGEAAIEALADIIQPASAIGKDPDMRKILIKKRSPSLADISAIIKAHKADIMKIMAALNGETVSEYSKKVNVISLPMQLLDIFNDPEVQRLFGYAVQMTGQTSSGSAMVNTGAGEI